MLRIKWYGIKQHIHTLVEVFRQHNSQLKSLIGKDNSMATYAKYRTTCRSYYIVSSMEIQTIRSRNFFDQSEEKSRWRKVVPLLIFRLAHFQMLQSLYVFQTRL